MGYATLIIDDSAMIWYPLPPHRLFSQNPQMSISTAEALKQIYSRYVGALQGASDFLRDDLPSASPGVAKWAQETGRRACRKYARQRGSVPFLTSDPSWDGICSGYWGAINEGPTSGGSYAPPFNGGQCAGTLYNYQITYQTGTRLQDGSIIWDAPITSGGDPFTTIPGPVGWADTCISSPSGSDRKFGFSYQDPFLGPSIAGPRIPNGCGANIPYRIISRSVSPRTGPDNCGNLPPEYTPPTFPPNLPPLPTTPTNPAPGFGNNWDVNILPDGQVTICIGGECSTGTPPGGAGGPDSGGGPGEPDGPPQENDPNDPDSENEITGCVEEGNLLTGLRIELTDIPSGSKVTDGNYYGVCWVYMGPDSEKLDMISDGRWVYDGQFFLPDSDSCTCFKVKVRYPWGIRVQAFSRPKEE